MSDYFHLIRNAAGPLSLLSVLLITVFPIPYPEDEDKAILREWVLYTFALVATVIVLAFLNWQFQHIGH